MPIALPFTWGCSFLNSTFISSGNLSIDDVLRCGFTIPISLLESGELKVGPADVVVIPELYGHVLEQIVQMPCQKIILCQAYDYILETLKPGFSWPNYGVIGGFLRGILWLKTKQLEFQIIYLRN